MAVHRIKHSFPAWQAKAASNQSNSQSADQQIDRSTENPTGSAPDMNRLKQQRQSRRHAAPAEPILDVNTTPLIDVMLVLLVMLIITIPVQLHAVNLNLPVGNPPPAEIKPEVVRIDIDSQSTVHWNGSAVSDDADLQQHLEAAAAQQPTPEVHVRPDPGASYDRFAAVMVAANRAGLLKLGVVGSEQFIEDK